MISSRVTVNEDPGAQLGITLERLTSIILRYLPPDLVRRIVHYGSTANGTARSNSDIDIAVFIDENETWRTKFIGYDQETFARQEQARLEINTFENHLAQTLPSSEKIAVIFVTPYDLGFFSFLTEFSPKGKLGDAWLDGKSLYCDPRPGWWHQGEGIEFEPSYEDYVYRALFLSGAFPWLIKKGT